MFRSQFVQATGAPLSHLELVHLGAGEIYPIGVVDHDEGRRDSGLFGSEGKVEADQPRVVVTPAAVHHGTTPATAYGYQLEVDERLLRQIEQRLAEDARLKAVRKLGDEEFRAFQDLGVPPAKMIAVVAEIAHCTLTNTFNRLAQTDLDDFLEPFRA